MDMMFRNAIVQYAHYGVEVLSSPDQGPGKPWIVTFENFVSDEQVDALIATNTKFERSTDTGSSNEFGETGRILSQSRTSSNSWCRGECESHPSVNEILRNIAAVTGVPKENYESFQVLKYEVGQRYGVHHDYGSEDRKLACGPRILTFFLYLSDVEEGGETAFPNLNIAVKPKKGKALLWPSVLNNDPNRQVIELFIELNFILFISFRCNNCISRNLLPCTKLGQSSKVTYILSSIFTHCSLS